MMIFAGSSWIKFQNLNCLLKCSVLSTWGFKGLFFLLHKKHITIVFFLQFKFEPPEILLKSFVLEHLSRPPMKLDPWSRDATHVTHSFGIKAA
jgi:hypothetical protein